MSVYFVFLGKTCLDSDPSKGLEPLLLFTHPSLYPLQTHPQKLHYPAYPASGLSVKHTHPVSTAVTAASRPFQRRLQLSFSATMGQGMAFLPSNSRQSAYPLERWIQAVENSNVS